MNGSMSSTPPVMHSNAVIHPNLMVHSSSSYDTFIDFIEHMHLNYFILKNDIYSHKVCKCAFFMKKKKEGKFGLHIKKINF